MISSRYASLVSFMPLPLPFCFAPFFPIHIMTSRYVLFRFALPLMSLVLSHIPSFRVILSALDCLVSSCFVLFSIHTVELKLPYLVSFHLISFCFPSNCFISLRFILYIRLFLICFARPVSSYLPSSRFLLLVS